MIRGLIGFGVLHAALCATGLAAMRALGLIRPGARLPGILAAVPVALLLGIALVIPVAIVLLVCGVPLTLITVAIIALVSAAVSHGFRRRPVAAGPEPVRPRPVLPMESRRVATVAGAVIAALYVIAGLYAFSRVGTIWDDARIWSLRGLTLTYHHTLAPTIFAVQSQSGGHPVYPLLQPALEAILSQAMGGLQLRWLHSELFLLFSAGIWTAGYLIARPWRRTATEPPYWIAVLVLVALTPAVLGNIDYGDADVTGALLLSLGVLCLGLWLESGARGEALAGGAFLAAAASSKNEDAIAAGLILVLIVVIHITRSLRSDRARLWPLAAVIAWFAATVAPWRIWTAAHHLTDPVEPPLPKALSPVFIAHRNSELHRSASAMLTQTTHEWGAVLVLFLLVSAVSMINGRGGWPTRFYVAGFALNVIAILWLYTTTPLSLSFLLPTSMYRTIDVFMLLAGFAAADQVARLGRESPQ